MSIKIDALQQVTYNNKELKHFTTKVFEFDAVEIAQIFKSGDEVTLQYGKTTFSEWDGFDKYKVKPNQRRYVRILRKVIMLEGNREILGEELYFSAVEILNDIYEANSMQELDAEDSWIFNSATNGILVKEITRKGDKFTIIDCTENPGAPIEYNRDQMQEYFEQNNHKALIDESGAYTQSQEILYYSKNQTYKYIKTEKQKHSNFFETENSILQ